MKRRTSPLCGRVGPAALAPAAILALLIVPSGVRATAEARPDGAGQLASARTFEDVFELESTVRLSADPECLLADITDFDIDTKGRFIVADGWLRKAVFVFAPDGAFIRELGRQGQGPGEYQTPVSVAIGGQNRIWVADYLANRISVYGDDFEFLRSIVAHDKLSHYIHLNSRDEIFMYSGMINIFRPIIYDTIRKYDSEGRSVLSCAPLPEEILKVRFSAGHDGMTIGADDFIYEMNPLFYRIRKYAADGRLVASFARKTDLFRIIEKEGELPILLSGPFYLEPDLVLAKIGESLEIYDADGRFLAGGLPCPHEIVAAKGGRLYVERWDEAEESAEPANPEIVCYRLKASGR